MDISKISEQAIAFISAIGAVGVGAWLKDAYVSWREQRRKDAEANVSLDINKEKTIADLAAIQQQGITAQWTTLFALHRKESEDIIAGLKEQIASYEQKITGMASEYTGKQAAMQAQLNAQSIQVAEQARQIAECMSDRANIHAQLAAMTAK